MTRFERAPDHAGWLDEPWGEPAATTDAYEDRRGIEERLGPGGYEVGGPPEPEGKGALFMMGDRDRRNQQGRRTGACKKNPSFTSSFPMILLDDEIRKKTGSEI